MSIFYLSLYTHQACRDIKKTPISTVVDVIAWALHCAGIQCQIHDFLLMEAPNTEEGRAQALSVALGVPVTHHKTEGPAMLVVFLGILPCF